MLIANDNLTPSQQRFQKKAVRFCGIGVMLGFMFFIAILTVSQLM